MSLSTRDINAWPSANATEVARWDSWEKANAWMKKDKANRLVEGLIENTKHKQVLWERVDKTKYTPLEFGRSGAQRWLNFYPEATKSSSAGSVPFLNVLTSEGAAQKEAEELAKKPWLDPKYAKSLAGPRVPRWVELATALLPF